MSQHEIAQAERTNLGFWLYLMTDLMLFGSLFAAFIVLSGVHGGAGNYSDVFSLDFVLVETMILLTSSFICGLAILLLARGARQAGLIMLGLTGLLGVVFLGLELYEFTHLVAEGHSWTTNGFFSSYFTLVGTHGLHILVGLIWLVFLLVRIRRIGLTSQTSRQLTLFGVFWHFLDIVWIFIFTIVYLMGAAT